MPVRFKLNESGQTLEQIEQHHLFIKKTKYFYKRLSQRLADYIFANQVKISRQATGGALSDLEESEDEEEFFPEETAEDPLTPSDNGYESEEIKQIEK